MRQRERRSSACLLFSCSDAPVTVQVIEVNIYIHICSINQESQLLVYSFVQTLYSTDVLQHVHLGTAGWEGGGVNILKQRVQLNNILL